MYQDVEGEPFCLNCPSGWRQDQDGQPDCLECLLGRFMSDAKSNSSACTPCNKGTYQDALGQSKCKSCSKGRYNENQLATSSSFCMNCPKGKYSSAMGVTNMTDCNACAAGKKNDNEGSSSSSACIDCLPNTKAETAGLDKCVDCDAGATSELGSSKCQLCEAGKYSDNVGGERECKSCDVGQYRRTSKSEEDATSCVDCLAGFYQSDRGQANCLPCIRESFLLVHELFSFFFHLPSSIFHMLTLFLFNFFNFNFILKIFSRHVQRSARPKTVCRVLDKHIFRRCQSIISVQQLSTRSHIIQWKFCMLRMQCWQIQRRQWRLYCMPKGLCATKTR